MDQDTLTALDGNYLDASRIFMGYSDTGEYLERRGVAIASCGLPVEELNWGFLKPPYGELDGAVAGVCAYFADRELPFRVTFRDGGPHAAAAWLEAAGWRRKKDPTPGMARPLPESIPTPPTPLRIEEVHTSVQLEEYRETAFRGFGYPVAAAHIFLNERLLALPWARLYSGLVEGAVVATSMMITTGTVAGIYWVSTLETQRGRGYGEALTWAAARGGRDLGCRIASLQASKLGRPVYARMGFEHVLDYVHHLPPEASSST